MPAAESVGLLRRRLHSRQNAQRPRCLPKIPKARRRVFLYVHFRRNPVRPLRFFPAHSLPSLFLQSRCATRIHGIGQEFPCTANRVVRVTMEDIRTSLRVSLNNCRNVPEQPCLSLFDGQTKAGSWPRIDRAQHVNQLPPKLLQALVVEIADDDHRPRISSGIRAPVRAQHAWQVLKKGTYPRVGRLREVLGYPTDSLKRSHLKRNLPADDTWNQFVEHSLAGLVLDQNFKVHPVEPRRGNRCTTSLPAATLPPPGYLLWNRHWRA